MFQTDSDEDVVFVSEKSAPKHIEIPVDKTKRLALQRDIDQQSRPKEPATPSSSQKFVALERQVEMVKRKMEQEISEENLIKKERKRKKGQVDDRSLAEVKKEKKKGKIVDAVVTEGKSWDENCEKDKKKKKRKPSDFFNDASVSQITDAKDDSKKKKKKKLLADSENQVETAESLVKEDGVEKKQKKKVKNKTAQIKLENTVKEEEEEEEQQQVEKDHLPKKTKKGKKHILTINSEETEKQIKEKTKKCPLSVNEITVTKTEKKAEVAENGILETPEYEVEEVKIKKKTKKDAKTKDYGNGVETTEIKGKNKKSNAASDKGLKDKKMLCKKEDKSAGIDFITEDKGKTELKKKAKKDKCKIATVEVDEEPKKKKGKKAKHEEEELLLDKSEEVMEDKQSDDTPKKKGKKKKSFAQVEHASKAEDELGAKKKKNKIKKEKQDPEESPQVDVVFLSEKSGNTDEITINQERRQALQMEIDEASQPEKPAKPTGFGQWSTAQFDSSEQQQKFLRLMGGFKKGFQSDVVSTGGANMALGKDAQQQLQQGLQGEFERAHSRRMDFNNRGAGLGFSAPSNKKFSIDINACRSVRFDD